MAEPIKTVALHNSMCKGCERHKPICNRVLFGGQPPPECPFVLEHVIGDQPEEDEQK
jgi:hypothetical protein